MGLCGGRCNRITFVQPECRWLHKNVFCERFSRLIVSKFLVGTDAGYSHVASQVFSSGNVVVQSVISFLCGWLFVSRTRSGATKQIRRQTKVPICSCQVSPSGGVGKFVSFHSFAFFPQELHMFPVQLDDRSQPRITFNQYRALKCVHAKNVSAWFHLSGGRRLFLDAENHPSKSCTKRKDLLRIHSEFDKTLIASCRRRVWHRSIACSILFFLRVVVVKSSPTNNTHQYLPLDHVEFMQKMALKVNQTWYYSINFQRNLRKACLFSGHMRTYFRHMPKVNN